MLLVNYLFSPTVTINTDVTITDDNIIITFNNGANSTNIDVSNTESDINEPGIIMESWLGNENQGFVSLKILTLQ